MKKFFKVILCLALILCFSSALFAGPKKKKVKARSASSASGLVSAKAKSSSASKKKSTKSSKKSKSSKESSGKKSENDKSSDNEEKSEISTTEQCMIDNLEPLLTNECKFLNDDKLLSSLNGKFYCLYNIKDKTKVESVYNYFLTQNYNTKEAYLKDGDVSVTIKNPTNGMLKGAGKYYEFILNSLSNKTLKEGRILDFLTEYIMDANEDLFAGQSAAVQAVSVTSTSLSMNFSKADIENCRKATKKVIQTCAIAGNTDMQNKIELNCSEYNSALMKDAADKKGKVLDASTDLAKILLNRVDSVIDAKNYKVDLDEKNIDLKKKENEIKNKKEELEKEEDSSNEEKKEDSKEKKKEASSADAK